MSANHPSRRAVLGALASMPIGIIAMEAIAKPLAAQQPHMQAAKEGLMAAIGHLELASADKGGHRVLALKAAKDALEHVEKGIRFDRRN